MIGLKSHLALVKTWMQTIKASAGFNTDAGDNVVTERQGDDGVSKKLIVGVYVTDVTLVNQTPMRRDWSFQITVECRVPTKLDSAEEAGLDVIEDLIAAIPTDYCAIPQGLKKLELEGSLFDRQPDGVPYNVVGVTLRGTCSENTNRSNS